MVRCGHQEKYEGKQCPFLNLPCEQCPRYQRYSITKREEKKMTDKTVIVKKTYSTSWVSSFVIAVIVGLIGLLITHTWEGFVGGLVLTLVISLITLACLIPFVGIYLYWIWANSFCDWFLGVTHLEALNILRWLPLIVCGFFGLIICVVFSILALVAIGAIIASR
jgi:uncharacterized membrane protein YkgB